MNFTGCNIQGQARPCHGGLEQGTLDLKHRGGRRKNEEDAFPFGSQAPLSEATICDITIL